MSKTRPNVEKIQVSVISKVNKCIRPAKFCINKVRRRETSIKVSETVVDEEYMGAVENGGSYARREDIKVSMAVDVTNG